MQAPLPSGDPAHAASAAVDADAPAARAPRRAPTSWNEISWVGFDNDNDAEEVATAALVHSEPQTPSEARPAGRLAPVADSIALPGSRVALAQPQAAAAGRTAARAMAGLALPAATLRLRLRQLLRIAAVAATMGVVAVFAYQAGERVAGLIGAPAPAAPVRPTIALAAPEPEREPPPAASIANAAGTAVERAAFYLERAKVGDPAAQFNLAALYARGDGLPQDFASAAAWFSQAAAAGNVVAQFDLGVIYERGLGVGQSLAEAVSWYRSAASQNYAPAQFNLAIAYAEGRGVPQDAVAAADWYRQAAMQGLVRAMVNLAILYEKGEGIERSRPDAYAWYRAAARAGDTVAEKRAQELFQLFSGPEKAKAVMAASALTGIGKAPAPSAEKRAPPAAGPPSPPAGDAERSSAKPKRAAAHRQG